MKLSGLRSVSYLSVLREGHRVMRAAGHLSNLLVGQVGCDQQRRHALVGAPVADLTVAVVTPGEELPVCHRDSQQRSQLVV